eukprot:CAMPEP_0184859604 /NCGR_PEP_ID=MMETSP0580-20130426/4596_1 /TAXON_ID=1118495 /ORGANISM="Dactyliosolen fragilissimus" /LENGTH=999 /DNA_ID=CAMNT_0027356339 /DNA_START=198 /DNA_END=3193 /DNA_ORIENTATION=+
MKDEAWSLQLPIVSVLPKISSALQRHPNLILEAPPGAGKTTIVPLALLGKKWQQKQVIEIDVEFDNIYLIEPRRVATRSAARRMSNLLSEKIGETVGYTMRDETVVSSNTRITVMTDGVLLQMLRRDPTLEGEATSRANTKNRKVDVIIFDEYHERGINADLALSLCREIQSQLRPDLRIIVMSATLSGGDLELRLRHVLGMEDRNGHEMNVDGNHDDNNDNKDSQYNQDQCGLVRSEGRGFPISTRYYVNRDKRSMYTPLKALASDRRKLVNILTNCIETVLSAKNSDGGDFLVFVPGAPEVRFLVSKLRDIFPERKSAIDVFPLYGNLPRSQQDDALHKPSIQRDSNGNILTISKQRIIVSTPIAEASLTLPDVTCVIDSGLKREPSIDPNTGMSRLLTVPCSQSSAIQRAGRAGRVREGTCWRIYNERDYLNTMCEHSKPEIQCADLSYLILLLLEWGYGSIAEILGNDNDLVGIPFVTPPPTDSLDRAFSLLEKLGAIEKVIGCSNGAIKGGDNLNDKNNQRFRLSKLGQEVVKIPCHPRLAITVAHAQMNDDYSLLSCAAAAAYLLDNDSGSKSGRSGGNDPNLSNRISHLLSSGQSTAIYSSSLLSYAKRLGIRDFNNGIDQLTSSMVSSTLGVALLPGYTDLIARKGGGASYGGTSYLLSNGKTARLDSSDGPEFVIVIETSSGDDGIIRIRTFVSIDKDALKALAKGQEEVYVVAGKGHEVRARKLLKIGELELSTMPIAVPPSDLIVDTLIKAIRELGGVGPALMRYASKKERTMIDELRQRVYMASNSSENNHNLVSNDIPSFFEALDASLKGNSTSRDETILEEVMKPFLSVTTSLQKLDVMEILRSAIPPSVVCQLEQHFPENIEAPDGSYIPVSYIGGVPTASAKLQQFFGTDNTPTVGYNTKRMPVKLLLLSPASKVLAETMDLPFFWKEVYPSIRAEMRGRYNKHPWPEDPISADPTRKTNRILRKELEENIIAENQDAVKTGR